MAYLRKYGTATTLLVPMIIKDDTDFAGSGDWTPASGDVKVSKDDAAFANVGTLPTAVGTMWKFTLSATEMQCARLVVQVIDSATKAVEDQSFAIDTYGNASANIEFDLDNATPTVNATKIGGTTQTGRDIGASVLLSSGTGTGQVKLSSGYVAPNWGDVGNKNTANVLTNTTISNTQDITDVLGNVGGDVQGDLQGNLEVATINDIRNAVTGGAYALDTDANGRMRVVDGTGAGEISLTSGLINGITGTITTLDGLNTSQNTQHGTTRTALGTPTDTDISTDIANVQSSIGGISSGAGGSVNKAMESYTLTTGTESANTEDDTRTVNGTKHEHTSSGGNLDLYYQFDIGGDTEPSSVKITGIVNGSNDDLEIHAYNWGGAAFEQVGEFFGKSNSTVNEVNEYPLLGDHVGTGANKGKVRIRLTDGSFTLTSATLRVDAITVAATITGRSVGYAMGAVWIDTNNGTAGTEGYVNGVADNPVDSFADAITLADSLGLKRFVVAAGSSITLAAAATNYELMGESWTLAIGGQSITGAHIVGATISGTFTGSTAIFERCIVNAITGPGATLRNCYLNEVAITNNGTSGWYLNDCASRIAGTGRATFDFGSGTGDTGLSMRRWSGGIELENMGQSGTDNASIEGFGNIVLNANCIGGTLARRGVFDFTNSGSGITIVEDELNEEMGSVLADTNELQTNQGSWLTATGFSTHGASDVWGVATRVLTANTNLNDPTAAAIADQVWAEAIADHSGTSGSTAEALSAAGSAGDPWTTSLPGSYTGTQAGKILADVLVDTADLQTNQGNWATATGFAVAGDQMDLVNAPNATAITAIQSGLATPTNITAGTITTVTNLTNKTGFSLASTGLDLVTAWTVDITGTVSGNSTHNAAAVLSAFGTGSTLTALVTATGFATPTNVTDAQAAIIVEIDANETKIDTLTTTVGAAGAGLTAVTGAITSAHSTTDGLITTVDGVADSILLQTGTNGVKLNATQPTGWAANLVASAGQIIIGSVDTATNSHTPTTTEFQSDSITEATADHYNGRVIIFTSGALAGQATSISDYELVNGVGQFTIVALTEAPANDDSFIIV